MSGSSVRRFRDNHVEQDDCILDVLISRNKVR
jgi:hypothetical protein